MPRPSTSHLVQRLRQLVLSSPAPTALFYARILYALSPPSLTDHETLHLLALAFLADNQPYSAIHLVRDLADDEGRRQGCTGCGMIVARCCQTLGRWSEGQAVLERALSRGSSSDLSLPNLASSSSTNANLVMAQVSCKAKQYDVAATHCQKALAEDPWLWEAFAGQCDMGSAPFPESLFPDPPAPSRPPPTRTSRQPTLSPNPMPRSSTSEVPYLPRRNQMSPLGPGPQQGSFFTPDVPNGLGMKMLGGGGGPSWDTPSVMGDTTFPTIHEHHLQLPPIQPRRPLPGLMSAMTTSSVVTTGGIRSSQGPTVIQTPVNDIPPKMPTMKRPRGHATRQPVDSPAANSQNRATAYVSEQELRRSQREIKSIEPNGEIDAPVRRSSRLKSTSSTSSNKPVSKLPKSKDGRGTRSRSATSSASGATTEMTSPLHSSTSTMTHPQTQAQLQEAQLQTQADDWLRDMVRRFARAYRCLSLFKCQEAIREIDTLPIELQKSAISLDILARSFYETANYVLARRAFQSLLNLEPYRTESTHYYSTILWHLGDIPALSTLAQTLVSINRQSAATWITAGNCFSLQKDHDEAMRCFKRATQVEPACAYAWTLCGYEAVEMEEFERGIGYYRSAIRADKRHYNAWYGMGLVYLRMGKVAHAEHHFRRAAEINPTNAVLLSCIGMVLEQQNDHRQALSCYETACRYAPDSSMMAFKRIRVLVALGQIEHALNLLEPLSRLAPDEAQVQFLLGKCLLRTNRRPEAMVAFTSARDLQPKLEAAIRASVEANGEEMEDEDED